ncbi:hypothetical protein DYB31_013290 [Aphanomyces astaci]|uniref:Uncharacterized protein n=1 Tax=Aphanomyces astaci TaxID=112090 RepID=A0A397EDX7_APHAT|nr:hypothetical protein DYB31_013290 [Aphanomyces astaci]
MGFGVGFRGFGVIRGLFWVSGLGFGVSGLFGLIYGSDAAITCLAEAPVTSIAMHQGTRALSSATLGALLFTENTDATELYEHIWFEMERLLEAAGNYTRVDEMGAFVTAMADDTYPLSLHRQVLIAEGHDMPTEGDLDDLWVEAPSC